VTGPVPASSTAPSVQARARARGRRRAAVALECYRWFVAVTDLLPASFRYGAMRATERRALPPPTLPVLVDDPREGDRLYGTPASSTPPATTSEDALVLGSTSDEDRLAGPSPGRGAPGLRRALVLRCALVTGRLDSGGVEEVVGALARGLPHHGISVAVFCTGGGAVERSLRAAGVEVVVTPDVDDLVLAVLAFRPEVVELHNAPESVARRASEAGLAFLPVVHNLEIHRSRKQWRRIDEAWRTAVRTVAVSACVGEHHLAHLAHADAHRVVVVPNGADVVPGRPPAAHRHRAREMLSGAVGAPVVTGDVVVLCLARYDAQKNLPGLVAAFDQAVAHLPALRLVVAGAVADPLELRRTEAARRAGAHPDRVHLLGASDAGLLRAAADVLVLDSFFEGWSIAASEAAAAGLPLVLSDAGGARELAARVGDGAVVVANPACAAADVDERAVRRARRARRQRNAAELADALVRAGRGASRGTARATPRPVAPAAAAGQVPSARQMVEHHAGLVHVAAATVRSVHVVREAVS